MNCSKPLAQAVACAPHPNEQQAVLQLLALIVMPAAAWTARSRLVTCTATACVDSVSHWNASEQGMKQVGEPEDDKHAESDSMHLPMGYDLGLHSVGVCHEQQLLERGPSEDILQ